MKSKDIAVKDKETRELRIGEELFEIEQTINLWKREINERVYSMGERFAHVKHSGLWKEHGYDSFIQWVADPEGLGMRPRTARMCMLLYKVWERKLAQLGMTQKELIKTDYVKIVYIAKKILKENDPQKILDLVHKAHTLTLRELQDEHEEETYIVFDGTAKCNKWLNERTGYTLHFSQGKTRRGNLPDDDASAQGWNKVFGQRVVEIRIRIKKDEKGK